MTPNKEHSSDAHVARRIVKTQALIGITCVCLLLVMVWLGYLTGFFHAKSALLATAVIVIPNGYFAWVSETSFNANRLLAQGVVKMVLTTTLIAVCIVVIGIEPLGFFVTLAALQLAYWVPFGRARQ